MTICKACTSTTVYKSWIDRHVVSCPSLYYQIPIAIHFLNFIMVLHCEDDIYSYDIALCINKTFIMIPSKPRLTTGTQKISQNCRIIKTREQAFQYSTLRHPIRILLRRFIFSALKKVRKSQQKHSWVRACLWLSFTVNSSRPCSSSVLSHAALSHEKRCCSKLTTDARPW